MQMVSITKNKLHPSSLDLLSLFFIMYLIRHLLYNFQYFDIL